MTVRSDHEPRVARIISGGQTGVDRAALDVALELGIPCGGWCPRGRRAESGPVPDRYPLRETPSRDYPQRTAWNVRDADATLVLTRGSLRGGTALTVRVARQMARPVWVVDLLDTPSLQSALAWLGLHRIAVLNVAGPRESENPGIADQARAYLRLLLSHERGDHRQAGARGRVGVT